LAVAGGKARIAHYLARHRAELRRPNLPEFISPACTKPRRGISRRFSVAAPLPVRLGMTRLIVDARATGLLFAISTPSAMEGVLALVQTTLGPDGPAWFAAIGAGDVVPCKKQAPDIHRWVLARLGVAAREAPAMEDSAPGLAAARGAELTTVITVHD
jgi:beta-phosphoglucomutase-like phosphatase (HAD superfamily)